MSGGRNLIDLTGKEFGYWIVIARSGHSTKSNHPRWKCQCICGRIKNVIGDTLRNYKSTNCGCMKSKGHNRKKIWSQEDLAEFSQRNKPSFYDLNEGYE